MNNWVLKYALFYSRVAVAPFMLRRASICGILGRVLLSGHASHAKISSNNLAAIGPFRKRSHLNDFRTHFVRASPQLAYNLAAKTISKMLYWSVCGNCWPLFDFQLWGCPDLFCTNQECPFKTVYDLCNLLKVWQSKHSCARV